MRINAEKNDIILDSGASVVELCAQAARTAGTQYQMVLVFNDQGQARLDMPKAHWNAFTSGPVDPKTGRTERSHTSRTSANGVKLQLATWEAIIDAGAPLENVALRTYRGTRGGGKAPAQDILFYNLEGVVPTAAAGQAVSVEQQMADLGQQLIATAGFGPEVEETMRKAQSLGALGIPVLRHAISQAKNAAISKAASEADDNPEEAVEAL